MVDSFEKSDPFVRQALVAGIVAAGGEVSGASLRQIGDQIGLRNVSASQIDAAAGSLCYKRKQIVWDRFWPSDETVQVRHHTLIVTES